MAGATEVEGYAGYPLLSLPELVTLHEAISLTRRRAGVACIALNTRHLDDAAARAAVAARRSGDGPRRGRPGPLRRRRACSTPCWRPSSRFASNERLTEPLRRQGTMRRCSEERRTLRRTREIRADDCGDGHASGCARPGGGCVRGRHRRERRHGQVRGRRRRGLLRADERARAEAVGDDDALRAERPDDDPGRRRPRPRRPDSRSSPGSGSSLAVYPYPPREIEDGIATPSGFAAWLTLVAQRYPTVKQFIVMNEPNQPALHATAIRSHRQERLGREGRRVPCRGLRRAEGRRPRRSA